MFGELVGIWLADLWQRAGRPERRPLCRARPRPRHAGRGCAAGDARRRPRRRRSSWSRPARCCAAPRPSALPRARWHDDLATLPERRPAAGRRQRIFRRLPVQPVRRRRRASCASRSAGRPLRPRSARSRPRPRPPRSRSSATSPRRLARAGRRGADRRLRPRPARHRRHAPGGVAPCLCRSVRGAGRARPHRPCRFLARSADAARAEGVRVFGPVGAGRLARRDGHRSCAPPRSPRPRPSAPRRSPPPATG